MAPQLAQAPRLVAALPVSTSARERSAFRVVRLSLTTNTAIPKQRLNASWQHACQLLTRPSQSRHELRVRRTIRHLVFLVVPMEQQGGVQWSRGYGGMRR